MPYCPSPTVRQLFNSDENDSRPASCGDDDSPDDDRHHADREALFFSRLQLPNGVFKTTARRRLDDVNRRLDPLLPSGRRVRCMDVAISSGISTVEWIEHLDSIDLEYDMTAGDLTLHAQRVSLGRSFEALLDRRGIPLQLDLCGASFPNASGNRWRNLGYKIGRAGLRAALWISGIPAAVDGRRRFGLPLPLRKETVQLVSPTLLAWADRVELIDDDIAQPTPEPLLGRFDVVRAANILNRTYFDTATLDLMIRHVAERLAPSGLLVIARTDEGGVNHGTIFRRTPAGVERDDNPFGLEAVDRFGDGADVDQRITV